MPRPEPLILAVNPGSTSTKLGLFRGDAQEWVASIPHGDDLLVEFRGRPIAEQLDMRVAECTATLAERGVPLSALAAVVGRGGLLPSLASGTYRVDERMLADLRAHERGEHASNLGALIAARLVADTACPAYIVDPVSVDEWEPVARLSGLQGLDRESLSHALNTKAIAKRYAREVGRDYGALRLVVIHCGSGTTVSAHRDGRMVDACNAREEGPFSMERAGGVPVMKLVGLAAQPDMSAAELERRLFREGGVYSYLGTRDLRDVLARIETGDQTAALVLDALLYQTAKEAGAMAAVLEGRVDAVLLTGGMMHAGLVAESLAARVRWIGPVRTYPGEDELRALAEGAHRVLTGVEPARTYPG
ncbi:MAG TPA: butyrate kinase [Longimicrobiales bacterium]|nr:butyrate kinase [Longimicrobiales bacterium]